MLRGPRTMRDVREFGRLALGLVASDFAFAAPQNVSA
jgi:hypothetical protein